MSVYLDAVFCPLIYENPCIFYQEGWHYELNNCNDDPIYKGVVFNEMKGAYSSSQRVILSKLQEMIFKDNAYRFESGGHPKYISDLSYDKFINTHQKFYHPSNAKIYLEGDLDLEAALDIISNQYLNHYDYLDFKPALNKQTALLKDYATIEYEIDKQEDDSDKMQYAFGKLIGDFSEKKRLLAIEILCEYLIGSIESPLKNALLSSGMVQDFMLMPYTGLMQAFLYGHIFNFKKENEQAILKLIQDTLASILEKGLDKQELYANLNYMEFITKEGQEPKALYHVINALNTWNYDGDPLDGLVYQEVFNELREAVETNYFEDLYREVFCNWDDMQSVLAMPSKTIGEQNLLEEKEKLHDIKQQWDETQIQEVIRLNETLSVFQTTTDTKEQLDTLPQLHLSDVSKAPEQRQTEVLDINGTKVLFHQKNTNGIVYLNIYFDLGLQDDALLPAIGFIPSLLLNLPTEHYSVSELQRNIKMDVGNLSFQIVPVSKSNKPDKAQLYLVCSLSVLEDKLEKAYELTSEVLWHTKWDTVSNIASIMGQSSQYLMQDIVMNGNRYGTYMTESKFSMESYLFEKTQGITFFHWLNEMMKNPLENAAIYENEIKPVICKALCKENMLISMTSSKRHSLDSFVEDYPIGSKHENSYQLPLPAQNSAVALQLPAAISYGMASVNLKNFGLERNGIYYVLSKIISLDYLWNEIRVKGGAYGAGLSYGKNSCLSFYSYRDPSALNSVEIYTKTAAYIQKFCQDSSDIEKFIIGTISGYEVLKSNKTWAYVCDMDYLRDITSDMRQKEKEQILNCTKKDLLACAAIFENLKEKAMMVVMGNEEVITQCEKDNYEIQYLIES